MSEAKCTVQNYFPPRAWADQNYYKENNLFTRKSDKIFIASLIANAIRFDRVILTHSIKSHQFFLPQTKSLKCRVLKIEMEKKCFSKTIQ